MRRGLFVLPLIAIASGVGAMSALADGTYHSGHYALAPLAGAPLRSGFVENIHPNGPNIYAHEQYVVNGAQPNTDYQVELSIFPGDLTCSTTPLFYDDDRDDHDECGRQRDRQPRFHARRCRRASRPHGRREVDTGNWQHSRVRDRLRDGAPRLTVVLRDAFVRGRQSRSSA